MGQYSRNSPLEVNKQQLLGQRQEALKVQGISGHSRGIYCSQAVLHCLSLLPLGRGPRSFT